MVFFSNSNIAKKIRKVAKYNEILSKSKATDKDVEEISNKIKDAIWKHYSKE